MFKSVVGMLEEGEVEIVRFVSTGSVYFPDNEGQQFTSIVCRVT